MNKPRYKKELKQNKKGYLSHSLGKHPCYQHYYIVFIILLYSLNSNPDAFLLEPLLILA